ncbi:Hypothetical protein CINCED_3A011710 [Cinara cedri]|uniref:Uncharacterized protein n=1 Tax=Cinara cedri TaxID=506608 RepID=A0A5E4NCG7_9HEMI|nr:Hypothetical protein CINCED_3A011710 [Cinara cedri]
MNILRVGISFSLVCCLNGLKKENIFFNEEFMDLEALPLEKLLKMKQELRIKDDYWPSSLPHSSRRTGVTADGQPIAMALQRRTDFVMGSLAGSSVRTAFQMSLTVLSFLAFGGYVIGLVTQNMRKPQQDGNGGSGLTAPQPLKTVIVNQNSRRPWRPTTSVNFSRRKISRRST